MIDIQVILFFENDKKIVRKDTVSGVMSVKEIDTYLVKKYPEAKKIQWYEYSFVGNSDEV